MSRTMLFGFVALAAGLFAVGGRTARADDPHAAHAQHFMQCAKACAACQIECDSCAAHCANLVAGGQKEHLTTLRTCQDCADICKTAASSSARGGPFAREICEACAKACDGCAKACEKHPDDKHMASCAKACRDCAKACRDMIGHLGHGDHGKK